MLELVLAAASLDLASARIVLADARFDLASARCFVLQLAVFDYFVPTYALNTCLCNLGVWWALLE